MALGACAAEEPGPPVEPAPAGYARRDFVVFSSAGYDLYPQTSYPALFPDRPPPPEMTISACAALCDEVPQCAGFSRGKAVADGAAGACFFKFALPAEARSAGDPEWQTFEKLAGPSGVGGPAGCSGDPGGIVIDRFDSPVPVPPAGVRLTFRVLGCDGNAVRPLTPADVSVLNDGKGQPFGSGGEGDSISDLASPSNFGLFSVLTLDMSDSIVNAGAQGAVVDGALSFVDQLVTRPEAAFKHSVAIVAFGRPGALEIIQDFTRDDALLVSRLEALRTSPSRGTTDLYNAYMQSIAMVAGQGAGFDIVERAVVILTDGTHEAGDEENLRTQALAAKGSSAATIYSIGIQGNYDESRLSELATSPENFVRAENAAALESAFAGVARKIEGLARSNYVIGVCTPVALGSASLTLRVDVDGKLASQSVPYDISQLNGDTASCDAASVAGIGGGGGGDCVQNGCAAGQACDPSTGLCRGL